MKFCTNTQKDGKNIFIKYLVYCICFYNQRLPLNLILFRFFSLFFLQLNHFLNIYSSFYMGQESSCKLRRQKTTDAEHTHFHHQKKIKFNPLHYVKPVTFGFDDPQIFFDLDLKSKQFLDDKENLEEGQQKNHFKNKDQGLDDKEIIYQKVEVKWHKFIKMKRKNFLTDYRVIGQIGKGGFGSVFKVAMRNGNILRAAKKINKSHLKMEQHQNLLAQMAIMMNLDHPNITKLYEVYDQHSHYVMILELCDGGELFQRIVRRSISQKDARHIMIQVLSALHYMHSKNIVHRDIKPENMLFQRNTKLIKIIDFGISTQIQQKKMLSCRIGTPYYIAPEVLNKAYDYKCDLWSLGIVLYMIIYNTPPFKGDTPQKIMQSILRDQILFRNPAPFNFSPDAMDFLKTLLNKDPDCRPTAAQALNHKWITGQELQSTKILTLSEKDRVLQRITRFHFNNKLEAVVYTYIVSQLLSSEEKVEMLEIFKELDINNNGIIQIEELRQALTKKSYFDLNEQKIKLINEYLDTNCSGFVDYTEFLVGALDFKTKIQQKHLIQAFSYFDIDGSGQITFSEVAQFLENQITTKEQIKRMFRQVDRNGDGVISRSEFVELLANKKMGTS